MKKIVLGMSVFCLAMAAQAKDTLDGCGLGWEVTQEKTFTATTTRGTTNSVVPPAFGMTTGTLGCDQLEVGQNDSEALDYVATNFEVLKSELAKGEGEYVQAMADTFGCQAQAQALGASVQSNYDGVVAAAQTPVELFKNIKSEASVVCL